EVKGRSVRDILARANAPAVDTLMEGEDEGGGLWAYRREYRSSYRAELGDAESLVSGQWFSDTTARGRERDDPVQISMELEVARELGVGLGDSLTWNVQGIRIHSVVTSLREVQWARFEPNFFVLFAPGALHDAPQTWVTLVRATDPVVRGQVQRQLAERAANIATVDLGQVQQALEAVIDKVVLAIRFMALFSLATGAIVLVGAVATSRWQRLREGTLLRTLGATRRQVLA